MEEELTDLLLEAAGRTNTGGRSRASQSSRRHHKSSYSDDGSDSRDNDSDDGRGYSGRKLSGSQVPLKKRLETQERDEDRSSHGNAHDSDDDDGDGGYGNEGDSDDDDDVDSIGSDLYKDDDDRQKLAQMTELEREMILTDRASKKSDRSLHDKMIKDRAQPRKQSSPRSHSRGMRSSTRALDRAADRDDALNEIRAKRARQQQDSEGQWKLRDAARRGSGSRGYSPIKRRGFTAATLGSSPTRGESDSHSNEGDSSADDAMDDSDDEKSSPESQTPTFEDIKEISIRRSKLAKWFMEPFFDELIVGCFVRVGIGRSRSGPIYRLCMVRNVDASDPNRQYKLENKITSKYLNVVWGNESSAARWQMAMVSDSPPLRDEYDQWVREVERSGGRMPSKQDVFEKKEAIQKSNTFVYSADTVKQMPLNVAAEKDRLRREMEVAKMKNDEAKVERIQARLQELEASRKVQEKDDKARRLAEMNRKNRVENFKNASELRPVNQLLKAGEAGYDPFSRRWTRSTNYFAKSTTEAAGASNGEAVAAALAAGDNNGAGGIADGGVAATAAALQAAAGAGKLVDTNAPVDQGTESNSLHDFDLPISLAVLQKFGGPQGGQAGFMARKQRIEATVGCSVPENDGRRHALTLSVSDYKRRRGLL
ncbi:unnamed protein product [Withania somnifera]